MRTRIEPPPQQGQVGADGLGAVGGRAFAVHVEGLVGARAAQVGHCAQRDPIDAAAPRDLGDRARLHVRAHGVGEALAHRLGHLLGAEGVRRDDPPDPHRVVDEAGQGVAPGGGALGGGVVDGHPGDLPQRVAEGRGVGLPVDGAHADCDVADVDVAREAARGPRGDHDRGVIGQVVLVFGLSFVATKPKGGGWTRCDLSSWLARSCWFYPGFFSWLGPTMRMDRSCCWRVAVCPARLPPRELCSARRLEARPSPPTTPVAYPQPTRFVL